MLIYQGRIKKIKDSVNIVNRLLNGEKGFLATLALMSDYHKAIYQELIKFHTSKDVVVRLKLNVFDTYNDILNNEISISFNSIFKKESIIAVIILDLLIVAAVKDLENKISNLTYNTIKAHFGDV